MRKGQIAVLQQFFQLVLLVGVLALLMFHHHLVGVENLAVQRVPSLFGDGEKDRRGHLRAVFDVAALGFLHEQAILGVIDTEPLDGEALGNIDAGGGQQLGPGLGDGIDPYRHGRHPVRGVLRFVGVV